MDDVYEEILDMPPQDSTAAASSCVEDGTGDFDVFVRDQYPGLLKFLARRCRSAEDAQDAAQESLARLVRYKSEPAGAWQPLLYRIALNVVTDRNRKAQSQHASRHVPFDELELASEQPSTEDAAIQAQQLALLREAILALPPKCRQVYLLKRLRGMSNAAIARHCGISLKTVEKHAANAILQLRRRLGQVPPDA